MTIRFETPHTQVLVGAGLSQNQARLYQLLLQKGNLQPGRVPRYMDISRPQAYKLLQDLVDLGVVTKDEPPGKPAYYSPTHPFAVQEILRKRKEELEIATTAVEGVMGSLISEYTTASRLPGVRIISDTIGPSELYKDILQEGEDLYLIRSTHDVNNTERLTMVLEQIKKQVSIGINTRIIGPLPEELSPEELKKRDEMRLTTRRVLPEEKFNLPAQIAIYNNKVGITTYEKPFITTIIENEAIAMSLKMVFEVIWNKADTAY